MGSPFGTESIGYCGLDKVTFQDYKLLVLHLRNGINHPPRPENVSYNPPQIRRYQGHVWDFSMTRQPRRVRLAEGCGILPLTRLFPVNHLAQNLLHGEQAPQKLFQPDLASNAQVLLRRVLALIRARIRLDRHRTKITVISFEVILG